ncbi:hypothetical protein ACFL1S_01150 [Pseudomonadota bacterium]
MFGSAKKSKSNENELYVLGKHGLGDDLMFFWSYVGGVIAGVLPVNRRLYFERKETRTFLSEISKAFPEVSVEKEPAMDARYIHVRHPPPGFMPAKPLVNLWRLRISNIELRNTFLHKCFLDHGGNYRRQLYRPRNLVTVLSGSVYSWLPPYPEMYDGWQELNIALHRSKKMASREYSLLSSSWINIWERVNAYFKIDAKKDTLLLPGGGSFKDFGYPFVNWLKGIVDLDVARFINDTKPSDFKYETIFELRDIILKYKTVITNDSLGSHVAQFYARKHILICTSGRPGNVCFPGALNTRVVDFGHALKCRPCGYFGRADGTCDAGFKLCQGQLDLDEKKASLIKASLT